MKAGVAHRNLRRCMKTDRYVELLRRGVDRIELRLAEIEMSLERARLAREGARIRLQDEQVQKQLKQQGAETARKPAEDVGPDAAKNRRWRRILGISGDGQ